MRRGFKTFLAEVGREMKKVSWPTKSETNRLFGVVMMVTVLLVSVLSGLGWLFGLVVDFVTKGQM
jgi:preprotein translocase SecE subunit